MRTFVATMVMAVAGLVAADAPSEPEEKKPPAPEVALKDKNESIVPGTSGDGWAEEAKVEVQAKDNTLTVLMTGTAAAHCRLGCQSMAVQTFQLAQEFEVTCDDPKVKQVVLSLESALNGTLWARHKASACMRLARAEVSAEGGCSPLSVAHPPLCVSAGQCRTYKHKVGPNKGTSMPLGRYVLTACFTVDAGASGFLNGHGQADFSAEDPLPNPWKQEGNPFKEVDRKDFGFALTLTADPPDDATTAGTMRVRPLVQRVKYEPRAGSAASSP
jgi:hypothetical protein